MSAPVAGASAAATPSQPVTPDPVTAAQNAFTAGTAAAQDGFAAGTAAVTSGTTLLRDSWASALDALGVPPHPYHAMDVQQR